jgi:hypothetical protein
MLLFILAGTSFLGAVFTWNFAIETKGLNLESLVEPNRSALLDHDEVLLPALRSFSFVRFQQLRENS